MHYICLMLKKEHKQTNKKYISDKMNCKFGNERKKNNNRKTGKNIYRFAWQHFYLLHGSHNSTVHLDDQHFQSIQLLQKIPTYALFFHVAIQLDKVFLHILQPFHVYVAGIKIKKKRTQLLLQLLYTFLFNFYVSFFYYRFCFSLRTDKEISIQI